jgi:glucose-1-phosphate thymidylyltransferase
MMGSCHEVVGLVPAAGRASRISPLPCSKELFPIGFHRLGAERKLRPKVAGHYLLERLRHANIRKAFIVLREGKWDIPTYFGDGEMLDMSLGYLMMGLPLGVPYTLDQAFPFVEHSLVALGFPDMIFEPEDAFMRLLERQGEKDADVVLGLFPAHKPRKTDMVELDSFGRVCGIEIKPRRTQLRYAWEIAVWAPSFTRFMHEFVSSDLRSGGRGNRSRSGRLNEMHVADVFQAAIDSGFRVETVIFENGSCLDIGTVDDMLAAIHWQAKENIISRP